MDTTGSDLEVVGVNSDRVLHLVLFICGKGRGESCSIIQCCAEHFCETNKISSVSLLLQSVLKFASGDK